MRLILVQYIVPAMLFGAIVGVAIAWYRMSVLDRRQGPYLFRLWSTHGVHVFDLVALAVVLLLAISLVVWLLTTSRRKGGAA